MDTPIDPCEKMRRVVDTTVHFIEELPKSDGTGIDLLKSRLKRFDRLYNALVFLISPVYPDGHLRRFIRQNFTNDEALVLNLGSGNTMIADIVVNIDMYPYPNVDIAADVNHLHFRDNSVDIVISMALLEHVRSPETTVAEINRVLKSGGLAYVFFPFIQGFHSSPGDYSRRTNEGLRELFREFRIVDLRVTGGPTSGFLWTLQEWLAMLLSFGVGPLYTFLHLLIMFLTFPLKFIDMALRFHPMAKNIATGFTITARKQ